MPNWLRYLVFFLIVGGVTFGMNYYVWRRMVHDPAWPLLARRIATIGMIAMGVFMIAALVAKRTLGIGDSLSWIAYLWMGLLIVAMFVWAGLDLGRALAQLGEWLAGKRGAWLPGPSDPERRRFFARSLAAVAGATTLGTSLYGVVVARRPRIVRLDIALAKLPPTLDGLRLVQISDIHVGATMDRAFVEHMVAEVNRLEPDVVAITGDLVDGSVTDLSHATEPLKELRATQGAFFVTGNHEFYAGAGDWRRELTRLGVTVLSNQRVTVGRPGVTDTIDLAGVEDPTSGRLGSAVKAALAGRDPARECVLLAHQPRSLYEAARQDVGLQLSGHTHGGQLWPWRWVQYLQQPFVDGLHARGRTQIYVSRGTGSWGPPMRIGAPPEITLLTLRRAHPA